jgi:hypothetical protein
MARAKGKEAAGAAFDAYLLYDAIARDFEGAAATAGAQEAGARATALESTDEIAAARKSAERHARAQASYERTLGDFLAAYRKGEPPSLSRSMSQLQIRPLLKRAADEDDPEDALAAQRLLELAFSNTSFYEPRDYMAAGDPARALAILRVADAVKPRAPQVCWGMARAQAQLGHLEEAFAELECVVAAGAADAGRIEKEELLAPLRPDPRFKALLERLRSAPAR